MANSSLVQVKIDAETKTDVTKIYESLGLDLPTAVRIFFKKSIAVGGLPFELRNDSLSERWNVYNEARKSMQKNNIPEMSIDEINAEISAARSEM
ncbi:MAG: type II toxin-antitoxin system RelB/DinJ family antitoxin [Treponema sp.]|nr:type II toxin-antitoxin system RelB/DinJ family antitoxin [Spirochaetia bacterium]MDY4901406.1 type II toxin-antitoxin system RelB/DinJ family antitoxin [Treponema sp.]